jgi:predicted kinase
MRKWMRDRLKRRKTKSETAPTEAASAPLQPDFYDNQPPAPAEAPAAEITPEPFEPEAIEDSAQEVGIAEQPQPVSNGDTRRRRRRRSRGGRGRSAAAQPVQTTDSAEVRQPEVSLAQPAPQAEAPVAVKAPVATAGAHKGTVVLAIGLPGSGKSAWFNRHNITPLSSDLLRALLFDDPTEQRFQDLVFSNLRSMLKARLIARRPLNYVDATNLTPHDRHGWIKLAKDYGYEVHAVFFEVPVEVCLQRNSRRARVVPEDVMRRMAAKLKPPTFEEGFARITVVRVKHKE